MSISSSRDIGFLRESSMAEGGTNLTVGHHGSSNYPPPSLAEIANSHPNKIISGHVDEEEGNNKREHLLLNHYNQDQSIKDGESSSYSHQQDHQVQAVISPNEGSSSEEGSPIRVLHIVTALAEYNSGRRGTIEGQDRLQEVMIPVLVDSVSTMISPPQNYQVDVYLILGWKLKPERRRLIEDALPEGVGLEVWDDATPLGYDENDSVTIQHVTRGLARQHRFVIKDKIDRYDFFSVFEDDMRITGGHISYFLEMTAELKRLYDEAPEYLPNEPQDLHTEYFHGPLSRTQLSRMMPGFLRAEVLLKESNYIPKIEQASIPVDLEFDLKDKYGAITTENRTFDPTPCCSVPDVSTLPKDPKHDQVMLWESGITGANVRQFPASSASSKPDMLDWMLLQPGSMKPYFHNNKFVGGFWAGRDGAFGADAVKPDGYQPKYFGQQGGWMATREQLFRFHHDECVPGFFPPFDRPAFKEDGLIYQNVEFWSGGIQLFSGRKSGCNMQRVISLHPDHFSKHFLYHTANNKQLASEIPKSRVEKVNDFYGQINSVVKAAKRTIELGKEKS